MGRDGGGGTPRRERRPETAGNKKAVVVPGMGPRLEVWSEARWKEVVTRIQRQAVEIAEKIDVSL